MESRGLALSVPCGCCNRRLAVQGGGGPETARFRGVFCRLGVGTQFAECPPSLVAPRPANDTLSNRQDIR